MDTLQTNAYKDRSRLKNCIPHGHQVLWSLLAIAWYRCHNRNSILVCASVRICSKNYFVKSYNSSFGSYDKYDLDGVSRIWLISLHQRSRSWQALHCYL